MYTNGKLDILDTKDFVAADCTAAGSTPAHLFRNAYNDRNEDSRPFRYALFG